MSLMEELFQRSNAAKEKHTSKKRTRMKIAFKSLNLRICSGISTHGLPELSNFGSAPTQPEDFLWINHYIRTKRFRNSAASVAGLLPNRRLNSRLNWDALS